MREYNPVKEQLTFENEDLIITRCKCRCQTNREKCEPCHVFRKSKCNPTGAGDPRSSCAAADVVVQSSTSKMQLPASSSMLALALLISGSTSHSVQSSGYTWVRGVNYVPSTSHNDVQTWQDYNSTLVEIELGYAAASGFNAVRVFLHSLPWIFNATAFSGHLRHFIQTAESLNLTSQLVIFDSCFGDVDANVSWITTGIYRNYTWIPNPGPAAVANSSSWPLYDEYATAVIDIVGSSSAVFLWDVMNEPAFSDGPQVVDFIEHMSALVASLDPLGRPRTVGIASSSQQSLVQDHVSLLSFHNYNGGGDGAALAQVSRCMWQSTMQVPEWKDGALI